MLRKLCLLFLMMIGWVAVGKAQLVKEFKAIEKSGFDMVALEFTTYKSSTQLKRTKSSDPVYIHGHLDKTNILPVFSQKISNNILQTSLIHKNVESENLGKSITSKLFSGSSDDFDHSWNVALSTNYLYHLDFNLGMGKSDFDLANLTISQLKVKSASADVTIRYSSDSPNQVQMDTLLVTLNMGTVVITNANFTNAKKMIFEVNYGKIDLNFSEGMHNESHVIAAVGAGSVHIHLPSDSFPIKIKMRTTAMCKTSLPKYLKTLEKGTYVTKGYDAADPRLMELIVDVGVGSLIVE
ncbi:DUF4097 family beta strand repeat-containing protein [Algoriphagus antarcticus]|uniref:Uncharacterized protein n=1 Tax=Algoriphagus antarcticus TaxID=238540 RepID=A0A3E0DTE3_9BACT|nr:DUF4097 family beta strand repeat-containing protein [Algoriphagus antarcticus]REG84748.1 hypothetical protein C8N25_11497 [Algoriphagus antarcticus]